MLPENYFIEQDFLLFLSVGVILWALYLRLLKTSVASALLTTVIAVFFGAVCYLATGGRVIADSPLIAGVRRPDDVTRMLALTAFILMVGFATGLVLKVYRAGVVDAASEVEREPNGRGVRAWLSPMNCITLVFFAISAGVATGSGLTAFFWGWRCC